MKQNPDFQKAQANMRPGVITLQGFLGDDGRDLAQIIDADVADLERLGVSTQAIANRMRELREAGVAGLGEFIDVPPHFEVKVDSVRGKLRCPFEDPGLEAKQNTTVRNSRINREIVFTDMNIHFIEKHQFFQGKSSSFRLNPEDLVEVLEIESSAE